MHCLCLDIVLPARSKDLQGNMLSRRMFIRRLKARIGGRSGACDGRTSRSPSHVGVARSALQRSKYDLEVQSQNISQCFLAFSSDYRVKASFVLLNVPGMSISGHRMNHTEGKGGNLQRRDEEGRAPPPGHPLAG